jgi:hypothetical protein
MSTSGARRATVAAIVVASALMSGCFTTSADFKEKAETFILENDDVAANVGVALTSATCNEPVDQNVGTMFTCTAIDADGGEQRFDVEIVESNRIRVTVADLP